MIVVTEVTVVTVVIVVTVVTKNSVTTQLFSTKKNTNKFLIFFIVKKTCLYPQKNWSPNYCDIFHEKKIYTLTTEGCVQNSLALWTKQNHTKLSHGKSSYTKHSRMK